MTMRECEGVRERLLDYVEGELDDGQHQAVERHLHGCKACTDELLEIERVRTALRPAPAQHPGQEFWDGFPQRVWQAYQREHAISAPSRRHAIATALRAKLDRLLAPRVWVPAAALSLIVGLAVLLTQQTTEPSTTEPSGIAAFQARIQNNESLATLARRDSLDPSRVNQHGFAAPAARTNYFQLGHWYAESLAYAAGGDSATARARLTALAQSLDAPLPELDALARGEPTRDRIAALEPKLIEQAARGGANARVLFLTGGWLRNVALAVSAQDRTALKGAAPEIERLAAKLDRGVVAPGALRDLRELGELLGQQTLSEQDLAHADRLIRQAQTHFL